MEGLRKPRFATYGAFLINGTLFASWIPHIPVVQNRLDLSEGTLGIALLGMAIGAVVSMPLSGYLCHRFSSRIVITVSAVFSAVVLPLPILASSLEMLTSSLFAFGIGIGSFDLAMNAQAVAVEKRYGKSIMSSFHGCFSLGGLVGSGIGGLALAVNVTPATHSVTMGIAMLFLALCCAPNFISESTLNSDDSTFSIPKGPLLGLGILTFIVFLSEGAIADWSAVFLQNVLLVGEGYSAAGFFAFSITMTIGRFAGDLWIQKIGPTKVIKISAPVAAIGLGSAVLIPNPAMSVIGFGLVGFGLSNLVPVFFSAAGRTKGVSPSIGIAAVATTGYFGMIAGPPLIGFAAEVITLSATLGIIAACLFIVAFFGKLVAR